MDKKHQYLFALMPFEELANKIEIIRNELSEKYQCFKALKLPVHITLYPPFRVETSQEEIINQLSQRIIQFTPFNIQLKNFNFFKNYPSPVVFIDVVENEDMKNLFASFKEELNNLMPETIAFNPKKHHPHITIAYRDVPMEKFAEIKKEYSEKQFEGEFEVRSIYLWKHDGKNWEVINEFIYNII